MTSHSSSLLSDPPPAHAFVSWSWRHSVPLWIALVAFPVLGIFMDTWRLSLLDPSSHLSSFFSFSFGIVFCLSLALGFIFSHRFIDKKTHLLTPFKRRSSSFATGVALFACFVSLSWGLLGTVPARQIALQSDLHYTSSVLEGISSHLGRTPALKAEVDAFFLTTRTPLSSEKVDTINAWLKEYVPRYRTQRLEGLMPFLLAHDNGVRNDAITFVLENGFARPVDEEALLRDLLERSRTGDQVALRLLSMR